MGDWRTEDDLYLRASGEQGCKLSDADAGGVDIIIFTDIFVDRVN